MPHVIMTNIKKKKKEHNHVIATTFIPARGGEGEGEVGGTISCLPKLSENRGDLGQEEGEEEEEEGLDGACLGERGPNKKLLCILVCMFKPLLPPLNICPFCFFVRSLRAYVI
jgi:hypothetical protein